MRYLGQHWMNNTRAIEKIVSSLLIEKTDTIIEVGPGRGALTKKLVSSGARIIAVEKDERLIVRLEELAREYKNLELVQGDILEKLPLLIKQKSFAKKYRLVGNIPYYLTGKLLRLTVELVPPPEIATFTIQREVALRLTAKPPKMNLLAAAMQYAGDISIIKNLSEKDFTPPPKVKSSIISITNIGQNRAADKKYYEFIKLAFAHPRKQLINNLSVFKKERVLAAFASLDLSQTARPQNLSITQCEQLSKLLKTE